MSPSSLVALKLLRGMTSISETPSVMMPRLSAELSGDRNNGPSPVLVPSYHFLIMCFSSSCPSFPCIAVVRALLLQGGAGFCETGSRPILCDLSLCLCVYRYVYFSCVPGSGLLWGSVMVQQKNHWSGSQSSDQESLLCHSLVMWPRAIRVLPSSRFHHYKMRICFCLCNREDQMGSLVGK